MELRFTTPDELHLWLLSIPETPPAVFPEAYALLSPEELARNRRYVFEKDRIRDLLTRMFVRQLLGAYLSADPAELQFRSDDFGRPSLRRPDHLPHLDFNLTHAGEMIVCAVVAQGRVGIDIEPVDRDVDLKLAGSFFAQREIEELFSLPEEQRQEHFLRLWTLKEAYIKARGEGMSIALDSFAFYGFMDDRFHFWEKDGPEGHSGRWSFLSLRPVMGYRIAAACQSPVWPTILLKKYQAWRGETFEHVPFEIQHSVTVE